MLSLVVSMWIAAVPPLASLDFTGVQLKPEVASFCSEHLAQQLVAQGLQVTTSRQIATLLGVERQKQLLGCGGEGESCMAEIASALGAPAVIVGEIAKLGTSIQVNVRVVKASNNAIIATFSRMVGGEEALPSTLDTAARDLASQLRDHFDPPVKRTWPLVPTVIAGVLAAGGGVSLGFAWDAHQQLISGAPASFADGQAVASRGELTRGLAFGAFIAAGVSLAFATVWYFVFGADHASPLTPDKSVDVRSWFLLGGRP